MVLVISRFIAIAIIITTPCALSSFPTITTTIPGCALPSFPATPFVTTVYVSLSFSTSRITDDLDEDAFEVLFSLEPLLWDLRRKRPTAHQVCTPSVRVHFLQC